VSSVNCNDLSTYIKKRCQRPFRSPCSGYALLVMFCDVTRSCVLFKYDLPPLLSACGRTQSMCMLEYIFRTNQNALLNATVPVKSIKAIERISMYDTYINLEAMCICRSSGCEER